MLEPGTLTLQNNCSLASISFLVIGPRRAYAYAVRAFFRSNSTCTVQCHRLTVPLRQFRIMMPYLQTDLIHSQSRLAGNIIIVISISYSNCTTRPSHPFPRFRHLKFPSHLLLFWALSESLVTQILGARDLSCRPIGNPQMTQSLCTAQDTSVLPPPPFFAMLYTVWGKIIFLHAGKPVCQTDSTACVQCHVKSKQCLLMLMGVKGFSTAMEFISRLMSWMIFDSE